WGEPRLANPQTSGPFVSRNNFGGYLALTLPLVLAPLLARTRMDLRRPRLTTQVIFGAGAAICGTALFFSLSRGSWGAAAVSLSVFLVLLVRHVPAEKRAVFLVDRRLGLRVGAAVAAAMLIFVLLPSGGAEMGSDIDRRLEQTVSNSASWDSRVESWRDSVPMIMDFPVLGVGLSSWGVAFPQYDESFFFGSQARRAHNDYIQLFAETGLVGGLMLVFACMVVARRFLRVLRTRSDSAYVLQLAIGAGLLALLIHEFVDFDLQMPGIAITAVLLLGIGLRGGWRTETGADQTSTRGASARPLPTSFLTVSVLLAGVFLVLVFSQPTPSGNREAPRGMMSALRSIEDFPVDSPAHLNLSVRFADLSPELARRSLDVAVAINPGVPGPRDARAILAARMGDDALALEDIEESMYRAPSESLHPLVQSQGIAWLGNAAQEAALKGLGRSVTSNGYRAKVAIAAFLYSTGNRPAAAAAWEHAAGYAPEARKTAALLARAGYEYALLSRYDQATKVLTLSLGKEPGLTRSWVTLIANVFGATGDLDAAVLSAENAVESGADQYEIALALAEAARLSGDSDLQERQLRSAIDLDPFNPRASYRLGLLLYAQNRFDAAATSLLGSVERDPSNARAWFYLGLSAERSYQFDLAGRAYAEGARRDTSDPAYLRAHQRFQGRMK
ncbi:O-antigen ligase family protein, partial [bacterium]|nr:O-antigen ligase family protein [bacterium]